MLVPRYASNPSSHGPASSAIRKRRSNSGWSFASKGRTIQRGQSPIKVAADQPAIVAAKLRIPPIKKGVVFPSQVAIEVVADGSKEPIAVAIKPVWMFHSDPGIMNVSRLLSLTLILAVALAAAERLLPKLVTPEKGGKKPSKK